MSKKENFKSMVKQKRKQKGITLVALVITIIILLILAGITISALTGSGLLEKANEAAEKRKIAEGLEKLKTIAYQVQIEALGTVTLEDFVSALDEDDEIFVIKLGETATISGNILTEQEIRDAESIIVTYKEYEYNVNKKLEVTYVGEGEEIRSYTVTKILSSNLSIDNNAENIDRDAAYIAKIIPENGYYIKEMTVEMGGQNISVDKNTGIINIQNVIGNIVINAVAEKRDESGFYDSEGTQIASWNTLVDEYGLDVEKDYSSSDYKTSESSTYYILKNNSEFANVTEIKVPDSIKRFGKYSFAGRTSVKTVSIGNEVEDIGKLCFDYSSVETIIIPDNVKSIGEHAFQNSSIVDISIGDGVSTIEFGTFHGCNKLKRFSFGNSISKFEGSVFLNVNTNVDVFYDDSINDWLQIDFSTPSSNPGHYSGSRLFIGGQLIEKVTIPSNMTSIKPYTFMGCANIKEVVIPSQVTEIGDYAFYECISLSKVNLPGKLEKIGAYAFSRTKINSVTIPSSVSTLGAYCFSLCYYLSEVRFCQTDTLDFVTMCFYRRPDYTGEIVKTTFYFKKSAIRTAFYNGRVTTSNPDGYYVPKFSTLSTNYSW